MDEKRVKRERDRDEGDTERKVRGRGDGKRDKEPPMKAALGMPK